MLFLPAMQRACEAIKMNLSGGSHYTILLQVEYDARNGALIAAGRATGGVNRSGLVRRAASVLRPRYYNVAACTIERGVRRPKQHCREQKAEWRGRERGVLAVVGR